MKQSLREPVEALRAKADSFRRHAKIALDDEDEEATRIWTELAKSFDDAANLLEKE